MLQPIMHILEQKKIILASSAEGRQRMIANIGLTVELCPSSFEEDLDPKSFDTFCDFVEETALQKVLEVEKRLRKQGERPDIIIGADTMVTLDGKMYGKPTSKEDAFNMLKSLSGKSNTVYTGVAVKTGDKIVKFTEKTHVVFGELNDEQINGYIATGEPMNKAGSYGIQGMGGSFVKRIDGEYFTVVGMPLFKLSSVLYEMFKQK